MLGEIQKNSEIPPTPVRGIVKLDHSHTLTRLLLSSKEHEGEEGQRIFEATDTFDESGEVHDGNIFETLEGIDETIFDECDDSEEEKSIADKLQELLKNNFSDDPLFVFDDSTIKELNDLYVELSSGKCNTDVISKTNIIKIIHETISNLKFLYDSKRTSKLWIQFMDFASIVRMFLRAERTGDWKLHLHATELMLPFFAAAGHNNYLKAVLLYLQDCQNLCDCLKSKYEKGLFTIWRKDKLFWSGTFTDQVIEQWKMSSRMS